MRAAPSLLDVLAEAATAMPWPEHAIEDRLLRWCRLAVAGDITIQELPAPPPDVSLVLADERHLVARRPLEQEPFSDQDRRLLVALTTMATTSRHAAMREARFRRQAVTDDLTGLWNHSYFRELFETATETRVGETMGGLFADVDKFKSLNDQLGHLDADEALREVGSRMRSGLPEGSLVARMGGDEFAAVVRHLEDADHLARVVADLRAAVSAPMPVRDTMLSIDVSIGCALSLSGADDPESLIREAERDMRRVKRVHRRQTRSPQVFDERAALRDMLDQGLVQVAYQPVVDLGTGDVRGYEALVRGRHLQLGDVSPLMLVDTASRLRLLDELSEVVVHHAIATMASVTAAAGRPVMLSVNIEFEQLRRHSLLLESLAWRLEGTGVRLVLEVSERQVGRWTDEQVMVASELGEAGIGLAVDDFGAGYSTLALLNSWEWTWVKIDRALVSGTDEDPGRRLLGHVAHMLGDLDLTAVVEGIETAEQVALIREVGLTLGQGTFLAEPAPADAVLAAVAADGLAVPHLR